MFIFFRDQGRRSARGRLTTGIHRVFRRLKFEPVEAKRRSRSSGTQISDKRGRFEIASKYYRKNSAICQERYCD
jgi:hypothetical protein